MKLQIIKNNKSKKFIVKMLDNSALICFEHGKTPSEILDKVNNHINNSINPYASQIWSNFKKLMLEIPKSEWLK